MKDTYLKFEKELEKCHDIDYPWEKALAEELAAYYNPGSPSEHWHAVNNMVGKWIKAEAEKCDITYPEVVKRDILYELKAMPSKKLFEYLLDHSGMDTKNCVVMARNIGRTAYLQSIKETCEKLKNLPNGSKEKEDLKRALNTVYGNYCYGITPKWICQEIENPELDKYAMWTRYNGELIPDPQCVVKVKKENEEMAIRRIEKIVISEDKKTGEHTMTVIFSLSGEECDKVHMKTPTGEIGFGVKNSVMLACLKRRCKPAFWHLFSEWIPTAEIPYGKEQDRFIKDLWHAGGLTRMDYIYWKGEVCGFLKKNPQGSRNFVIQDGKKKKGVKTEPKTVDEVISEAATNAMNTLKEVCDGIANPEN